MEDLNAKQINFLEMLLRCRSIRDAAAACEISEATAYNWLKDETFKTALQERLAIMAETATARLKNLTEKAISILAEQLDDNSIDAADIKFRSASKVLDLFFKFAEYIEFDRRIAHLETQVLKTGKA